MAFKFLLIAFVAQLSLAASATPAKPTLAPTLDATTASSCGVRVSFNKHTDTDIHRYQVYATGGGKTLQKMAVVLAENFADADTSIGYFVTGLKKTTSYIFHYTAVNKNGEESPKSDASSSITTQNTRKYLFVSDYTNSQVLKFDYATKEYVDVFIQPGSGGLKHPWGIKFNTFDDPAQPRTVLVASEGTKSLLQYDACDGTFIKKFASVPGSPRGLTFYNGKSRHTTARDQPMLLAASFNTNSVNMYNAYTGAPLGEFCGGVDGVFEVVVGPDSSEGVASSDIYGTSEYNDGVYKMANSGTHKCSGSTKITDKKVNYANGMAFGTGDSTKYLYATGPYAGNVIVKFDLEGKYVEHFEDKELSYPLGMLYDAEKLFVNDKNTIRTYDAETGERLEVWATSPFSTSVLTFSTFHEK